MRAVTQTSQREVLKPFLYLCSRVDANQHKPTLGVYLLHFPACLMTCKESVPHLGAGHSLDSRITKERRKESATTYGFHRMEMTAPNCELNFVLRTTNKNNKKIRMLLASSHLLRCIPNRPLPKVLPAIPLKDYVRKAIQGHPILSFRY